MITITYNEVGDVMILRAEGHAGFAPKGQDIVCAAVSTLMQTLAYSLDGGTVTYADDRNLMEVQAKQNLDSVTKFELVTDGLILLADAYPEHVRYINLHADKADAIDLQLFATATTAASGGSREELLGPRPAGHEHKALCEVDAGSRNPDDGIDLQLFADGGDGTSQSPGGDSSPGRGAKTAGAGIELPAMRPAEERLARRSGVMKRSGTREAGSPSQSAQSAASSPEGGALGRSGKSELGEEGASGRESDGPATEGGGRTSQSPGGDSSPNRGAKAAGADGDEVDAGSRNPDGTEDGSDKAAKSPEERRAAFRQMLTGEYSDLAEEMMQNAVNEAAKRLEASPAMKGLMQALAEKYGTDANDLAALTEAVKNGAVKDDAYYEKLAMEKGVSTKTARELDKLESQNKRLTAQQQMIQQMERARQQQAQMARLQAGWDREAEALKAQYPDFNMTEVLANPEVAQMMRSGVSMTNAYRSAYFDHILKQQQAATAQQVEKGVIDRVQQRNARPSENGTRPGGAVQSKIDVAHLSRRECEDIERRVMRGEVITL